MDKSLVGKIAKCGRGRLGLILDRKTGQYPTGTEETYWTGIGLDGEGYWTAREPTVVFESLQDYILSVVQRSSWNGRGGG